MDQRTWFEGNSLVRSSRPRSAAPTQWAATSCRIRWRASARSTSLMPSGSEERLQHKGSSLVLEDRRMAGRIMPRRRPWVRCCPSSSALCSLGLPTPLSTRMPGGHRRTLSAEKTRGRRDTDIGGRPGHPRPGGSGENRNASWGVPVWGASHGQAVLPRASLWLVDAVASPSPRDSKHTSPIRPPPLLPPPPRRVVEGSFTTDLNTTEVRLWA
jgi:hypothetical protein